MRTIKIYTTAGMPGSIETNVISMKDLIPQLVARNIPVMGMKLLEGTTKEELLEDSPLPEGDFKLYITPAKTKSGAVEGGDAHFKMKRLASLLAESSKIIGEISSMIFNGGIAYDGRALTKEDIEALDEVQRLSAGIEVVPETRTVQVDELVCENDTDEWD